VRPHHLHGLLHVAVPLELDVGEHPPGDQRQDLLEQRRLSGAHALPQRAVVERGHRRASNPGIVDHHQAAVAGATDVEFDHVATQLDGPAKRCKRVLRRRVPGAAMGDDQRTVRVAAHRD
jgi:hypothetical protein